MTLETKIKKQRRLMQNIEDKLNTSADAGRLLEGKFLTELQANKIKKFFDDLKLEKDELNDMQIVAFSRMIQAEQRLEFVRHVLSEILPEIWELKKAIQEKQGGGPKRKVSLNVATHVYTQIGLETKAFPRKDEFTERLNHVLTGSRTSNEDANFAVSERTIDNYTKTIKIMIAELFAESLKAN